MKEFIKQLTCICCPKGCSVDVYSLDTNFQVESHKCLKGKDYAILEMTNPTRFLTTTIAVNGNPSSRLAVRTNIAVPKSKILEIVNETKRIKIKTPVYIGQILISNVAGTDADLIAASEVLE